MVSFFLVRGPTGSEGEWRIRRIVRSKGHGGLSLLQMQIGFFRLLAGAAYRAFRGKFALDFHTHEEATDMPYTFPALVRFSKSACALYKAINRAAALSTGVDSVSVVDETVVDEFVQSLDDELLAVHARMADLRSLMLASASEAAGKDRASVSAAQALAHADHFRSHVKHRNLIDLRPRTFRARVYRLH